MQRNQFVRLVFASFITALLLGIVVVNPVNANYTQRNSLAGIVYTESNIPTQNGNTIIGYRRDANGNLTPLPGSPYPTNGAGITSSIAAGPVVFDTDQNVIVNPEHTLLFAVNSGSNTIAVFRIKADGSLSPVQGSPFPSGGVNPVSLGLADKFLYVAHRNIDPQNPPNDAVGVLPNYTAFRVNRNGRLTPIPNSTIEVPAGTTPSQVLISSDDDFSDHGFSDDDFSDDDFLDRTFVFGADQFGGVLRSFKVLPNGRLWQAPNSPLRIPESEFSGTNARVIVIGLDTHPTRPLLYTSFASIRRLAVYSYDKYTGALKFIRTVPNSGRLACWIVVNKKGTILYTSDPGNNTISVFSLANPEVPVEIQNLTLKGVGSPFQISLDPTESFLHAVSQRNVDSIPQNEGNGIRTLKVNLDGTLTEVNSSPVPITSVNGSRPQGLAVL